MSLFCSTRQGMFKVPGWYSWLSDTVDEKGVLKLGVCLLLN